MIVVEHSHERGAAATALDDDRAHRVPRLHERYRSGGLAADAAVDFRPPFAQVSEISADAAAELADHRGVLHGVENPLDAVSDGDDKTREELLVLRLRLLQERVIRERQRLGISVDPRGHFGLDGQPGPGPEEARRVEQEPAHAQVGVHVGFERPEPFERRRIVRVEIQRLRRGDDPGNAARELVKAALPADGGNRFIVTERKVALGEKPLRILRQNRGLNDPGNGERNKPVTVTQRKTTLP